MSRCAVFTLGKDERFHLPMWIGYYGQFFAPEDMYILDHDSQDPATREVLAAFTGNTRRLTHPVIFDHDWILATIQGTQREILAHYDYVLYADADEWVVPTTGTLGDFLAGIGDARAYRCTGYEVVENSVHRSPNGDKTLLSSIPLTWEYGCHRSLPEFPRRSNLRLYHLHQLDFAEAWAKNQRWQNYPIDAVARERQLSWQNQITDLAEFKRWFYARDSASWGLGSAEPIPDHLARYLP